METPRKLADLTREQLYELVWSTPVLKLAEQFGVSNVAIAKRCRRLAVPRPTRGYWVKLEFGKKPERPPLPPSPEETAAQEAQNPSLREVRLPAEGASLHPLAEQYLARLLSSKLRDSKQRIYLEVPEFPTTEVSRAQAPRAARAFHAILTAVEPRGIFFRRGSSAYSGGMFRKGHDRLYLKIEEEIVEKPGHPLGVYSRWSNDNKTASGKLTFTLNQDSYGYGDKTRWSEQDRKTLSAIVSAVGKELCRYFAQKRKERADAVIQQEKMRIEWEIRRKKYEEEEAIRTQEKAKRAHADALAQIAQSRLEALFKASERRLLQRTTEDFIAECERCWRVAQAGELLAEQIGWLSWARESVGRLSPFKIGYPEPSADGPFDPAAITFGGPYPAPRKFPSISTDPKALPTEPQP